MTRSLWKISVAVSAESEEAAVALLQRLFPGTPSVYLDMTTGNTTVDLYLQRKTDCTASKMAPLKAGLQMIRQSGLDLGSGRITISRVRSQDWAESWKNHFRPLIVGRTLLIKPTWVKQRARSHQVVVELDPGLSFGTGHHPTTRFCLEELVRNRPRQPNSSLLDVGTGSGILAIAAAKLGYQPVVAFDCDPLAVRIARENASLNGVSQLVKPVRRTLGTWSSPGRRRFDLIVANLSEDLLVEYRKTLQKSLAAGGKLILAGIPTHKFPEVANAYDRAGFICLRTQREGEWGSGTFSVRN